ncbi:MAG: alpha/beta hydrolase [Hyphomonadaceae bacterium]
MKTWLALGFALVTLGGCISYTVDEGWFFRPRAIADKAMRAEDMKLNGEENLLAPGKFSEDFGRIFPNFAKRIPAQLTHNFVDIGGQRIAVTHVAGANAAPGESLIVACMGQTGDRRNSGLIYAAKLLPWGEALLIDYPGYGDSGGQPDLASFSGFQKSLPAFLDKAAKDRPLILWGHSLGGPVCSAIAAGSREADAIVLETTVPSFNEMMDARKPWFTPPTFDLQLKEGLEVYDIPTALAGFSGPVLVIGAGADSVLPVAQQRILAARLKAEGLAVTYVETEQSEHLNAALNTVFVEKAAPFFAGVADARH